MTSLCIAYILPVYPYLSTRRNAFKHNIVTHFFARRTIFTHNPVINRKLSFIYPTRIIIRHIRRIHRIRVVHVRIVRILISQDLPAGRHFYLVPFVPAVPVVASKINVSRIIAKPPCPVQICTHSLPARYIITPLWQPVLTDKFQILEKSHLPTRPRRPFSHNRYMTE